MDGVGSALSTGRGSLKTPVESMARLSYKLQNEKVTWWFFQRSPGSSCYLLDEPNVALSRVIITSIYDTIIPISKTVEDLFDSEKSTTVNEGMPISKNKNPSEVPIDE